MADIQDTDLFLVNRNNTSYQVPSSDLMAELQDDDLLLVNRSNKSYKITGAEFKGSLSSPPTIGTVTLSEDDPAGARFTSQDFTTTVTMLDNGNPASTKSIRGWIEGSLTDAIETDVITGVSPDGKTLTFASDKDLAKLQSGDPVTQDSGFDSGSINATDFSSNGSHGAINGPVSWQTTTQKYYGGSMEMTGNSSYIEYAENDTYGLWRGDEFTIMFWVYPTVDNRKFFGIGDRSFNSGRGNRVYSKVTAEKSTELWITTGYDEARIKTPDNTVPLNTWTHIMFTGNGSTAKIYINGTQQASAAYTSASTSDPTPLFIGASGKSTNPEDYTNGFKGFMQDIAIWKKQLSPSDIPYPAAALVDSEIKLASWVPHKDQIIFACPYNTMTIGSGIVGSVDVAGNSLNLATSNGTWGPANAGHYAIGPTKVIDNSKKYLNLDSSLNVIGLTDTDTYTSVPGNSLTPKISFPAVLDNGQSPDATLADGTSIQTEIKAENTAGSDEMESNVVTPSPSCISGPIILDNVSNVSPDGNTLTFDSDKDFKKLQTGDQLVQSNSGGTLPLLNCPYTTDFNSVDSNPGTGTLQKDGNVRIETIAGRTGARFASLADDQNQSLWYSDWTSVSWTSTDLYVSAWLYITGASISMNIVGQDTSGDSSSFQIFGVDGGNLVGSSIPPILNKWFKAVYIHSPSTNTRKWIYDDQQTPVSTLSGVTLSSKETLDVGVRKRNNGSVNVRGDFYISELIVTATPVPVGDVVSVNDGSKEIVIENRIGNFLTGNYVVGPDYVCPPITLSADDPADVATFEAIKDSLDDYAGDRAMYRAELRQRLIDAGFLQSELATMSLVDEGEVAFAKEGYFPLYLTEAEANNASTSGTSHAHTIEGDTFYMPDAGVTLYHGNYTEGTSSSSGSTDTSGDSSDSGDTSSNGGGY